MKPLYGSTWAYLPNSVFNPLAGIIAPHDAFTLLITSLSSLDHGIEKQHL